MKNKLKNQNYSKDEKLTLDIAGKLIQFFPKDLLILEGDKGGSKFIFDNKEVYKSTKHLGHYSYYIEACKLFRVHKSHYVNLDCFLEFDKMTNIILMPHSNKIPVSRTYKKELMKSLKNKGQLKI